MAITLYILLQSHLLSPPTCPPPRAAVSSCAPMEFTEDHSFVVAPGLTLGRRRNLPTTGLAGDCGAVPGTHCSQCPGAIATLASWRASGPNPSRRSRIWILSQQF